MRTGMRAVYVLLAALVLGGPAWAQDHDDDPHGDGSESRYSDEPIPLEDIPTRPRPLIEIGPKFLGTGNINQGFTLPTGAVWTPAFMLFGTIRTATQGIDNGVRNTQFAEGVARLDLFGNLYLTPTERIVAGVSPLNQEGRFTTFNLTSDGFPSDTLDDFQEELNFRINTLFFEGDIAEIFPKLDWDDSSPLDYYVSVGRQPLSFQDGILINEDALDMVGLTRANMRMGGLINTRAAAVFGWGDVNRHSSLGGGFGDCDALFAANATAFGNCHDESALLFGLLTETDTRKRTVEIDAMYVLADDATGDGVYGGFGTTQRIGQYNNTFRVVGSYPVGDETVFNQAGVVIHNQFGYTPHHTHNWLYINLFGGIGKFRSAARGPAAGGPLGQTGLLFAAVGLGRYGAALGNQADESVGGGIGYQMFFGTARRQQLILEAGGRYTYGDGADIFIQDIVAGAARYSLAVGRRGTIILDGFGAYDVNASKPNFGTRVELAIQL